MGRGWVVVIRALGLAMVWQAQAQTLERVWSPPRFGSYHSMQLTNRPPTPFLPPLPSEVAVYRALGAGIPTNRYYYDDRQIDYAAVVEARSLVERLRSLERVTLGEDIGGDSEAAASQPSYGSNDLWLEMVSMTCPFAGYDDGVASVTVHRPAADTNNIYRLSLITNLTAPFTWEPKQLARPGQTNVLVDNLPETQGFLRLESSALRAGFRDEFLEPNDDDCQGQVDGDAPPLLTNLLAEIGFRINFAGTTYTNLYVNNNGNVTFAGPLTAYTPVILTNLGRDIIAPFWADVDTRATGFNDPFGFGAVSYGTTVIDGHLAFGVNWIDVGYYGRENDHTNSFQLVLMNRSDVASGDFDMEFNYGEVQWEAGDVSGGWGGLWLGLPDRNGDPGRSAAAGYASTNNVATTNRLGFEMFGSGFGRAFLDSNKTNGLIHNSFNSTVLGRYVFQFRDGFPLSEPIHP